MYLSTVSVIFSCIFALTQAAYDQKQILELTTKCKATPEDTRTALNYTVPETPTGKCLMLCMIKELNMLDSNDKYDEVLGLAALRKYWTEIKDAKLLDVNTNCVAYAKTLPPDTPSCEYGYKVMKCINSEFIKGNLFEESFKKPIKIE